MPSTREMRERLSQMLTDINSLLVSRWLNDPRENPEDVGETVGLMLQVVAGLMGEIDVFIGGVDTSPATIEAARKYSLPLNDENEMRDLESDEPVSSLIDPEASFGFAKGAR